MNCASEYVSLQTFIVGLAICQPSPASSGQVISSHNRWKGCSLSAKHRIRKISAVATPFMAKGSGCPLMPRSLRLSGLKSWSMQRLKTRAVSPSCACSPAMRQYACCDAKRGSRSHFHDLFGDVAEEQGRLVYAGFQYQNCISNAPATVSNCGRMR